MGSNAAYDALIDGACDAAFGEEAWTIAPMTKEDVNAPAAADATRTAIIVTGIYDEPAARAAAEAGRSMQFETDRGSHATSRPSLSIKIAGLAWRPRKGDRAIPPAGSQAAGRTFRIAEVRPDGSRLDLDLNG